MRFLSSDLVAPFMNLCFDDKRCPVVGNAEMVRSISVEVIQSCL